MDASAGSPVAIPDMNVDFSLSLLAFWIKGNITIDYRKVSVWTANTVLGVFPAGFQRQTISISKIARPVYRSSYKVGTIALGVLISMFSFSMMSSASSAGWGLFCLLLGPLLVLNSIRTTLYITGSDGFATMIDVPFYERGKIQEVNAALDSVVELAEEKHDNLLMRYENEVQRASIQAEIREGLQAVNNRLDQGRSSND